MTRRSSCAIWLTLLAAFFGGQADADDDLMKGKVNKSDLTPRITRPTTSLESENGKVAPVDTAALKGRAVEGAGAFTLDKALDPRAFARLNIRGGGGAQSGKVDPNQLDDAWFALQERNWRGSSISRETGLSNVNASVSLAVCAPYRQDQRQAWKQLMLEISDRSGIRDEWMQWQEVLCNELMVKRFIGPRMKGRAFIHLTINRDGTVQTDRPYPSRHGDPFDVQVREEIKDLIATGKFKFPARSAVTQVHAMINVSEDPTVPNFPY